MLNQLRDFWNGLEPSRRLRLVVLASLTVAALVALISWTARPSYRVAIGNLEPKDAGDIQAYLKQAKIPNRLGAGGTAIEVPADMVDDVRVKLATENLLPSASGQGYDLFDRSTFPGTDFINQVNYQRALEGELGRTISHFQDVESARVHLVMPDEGTLWGEPEKARAAVVLTARNGTSMSPQAVRAIVQLVAGAVRDLDTDNVSVSDTQGQVLSPTGGSVTAAAGEQLQYQAEAEGRLERKMQSMLDDTFGPGLSLVRVNLEMNFDKEESTENLVEPSGARQGVPEITSTSRETYSTAAGAPVGAAGTAPNIWTSPPGGASRPANYDATEETQKVALDRRERKITRAIGTVTRMSVAAVVDESVRGDMTDAQIRREVQRVLEAATGFDQAGRQDRLEVSFMPVKAAQLAATAAKEAAAAAAAERKRRMVEMIARYASIAAIGLLVLVLHRATVRVARSVSRTTPLALAGPAPAAPAQLAPVAVERVVDTTATRIRDSDDTAAALRASLPSEEEEAATRERTVQQAEQVRRRAERAEDSVRQMAEDQPEAVARVLEGWLRPNRG